MISHLAITITFMMNSVGESCHVGLSIKNVISHSIFTITFMTNSVGESRHVGHSMIHFKSVYFYAVISFIAQIQAHMHLFDKHFEEQ